MKTAIAMLISGAILWQMALELIAYHPLSIATEQMEGL